MILAVNQYIVLSELSVNLSAGWFGVVFIGPNFAGLGAPGEVITLLGNVILGIFFLVIAMKLRSLSTESFI